ncbi:hypothetical protein AGOR_G00116310 [Albula goreensis]|uniref:Uncharacterized protein n=1 Tax=Albula goreensis TaxID=1534307 RepID=A0A8T3DGD0_9TELE|nr:hypothetical protein AGOR_G00116310 [Albula goreensis]
MWNRATFQTHLSSIMDLLTKGVFAETEKLFYDSYAELKLEMCLQVQNERLDSWFMKGKLFSIIEEKKGKGLQLSGKRPGRSLGVQVGGEFSGAEVSVHEPPLIGLWGDGEPTAVAGEETPLQSVTMPDKSTDMERERPESVVMKEGRIDDAILSSDLQQPLMFMSATKSNADARERLPNGGQYCEEE